MKVLAKLPADLKTLAETYYWTGWRNRELLTLRWSNVDFMHGEMKLDAEQAPPRTVSARYFHSVN